MWAISRAVFAGPPLSWQAFSISAALGGGQVPATTYGAPALQPDPLFLVQVSSPAAGELRVWTLTAPPLAVQVHSTVTSLLPWSDGVGS